MKWKERQKEAHVIGRRGRTSEGEHLPRTRSQAPAAVHRLAAAADVSPWTKKDRAEKGTRKARGGVRGTVERKEETRIMNTYACTYRGGTSFTASHRSDRGREGGHGVSDSRAAARHYREQMFPTLRRSLSVLRPSFFPFDSFLPASDGCALLNLVLCTAMHVACLYTRDSCFSNI